MLYYLAIKNNELLDLHRNKRAHTAWFHLYKVQEQAKVIYGDKSQSSGGNKGILNEKGYGRIFLGDKISIYLVLQDDYIGII